VKSKTKAIKTKPLFIEELDAKRLSMRSEDARPAKDSEITLEALAQMMDEAAESCNAHDFVCVHRGLAVILFQELGRADATKVMRRLANYTGLYGMTGVCGEGDVEPAEKELGVSLHDWSDWKIH
jgi:hypothetical protein